MGAEKEVTMELNEKHTWVETDLDAIKNNYDIISEISDRPFYVVLKADAYGHGAKYLAGCYRDMGAFGFCVSSFAEAMELRKSGITKPILILGHTDPSKAYDLFKHNLTQAVLSYEYAAKLNACALYPVDCQIALDTGMGRIGFDLVNDKENSLNFIKKTLDLHSLNISGVFSHFPVADSLTEHDIIYTQNAVDLFDECVEKMKSWGFKLKYLSGQNSRGIARKLGDNYTVSRAGIILYGEQPSDEVILPGLKTCMKLKTVVTNVKTVPAGRKISYGLNFTAERETKVATLRCGYADGVPRILSFVGHSVNIGGKLYPVIGNICMDQMMIDITDAEDLIAPGDEVLVMGGEGVTSLKSIADRIHTIPHEIMCGIAKRVPRVYVKNGSVVHIQYGI